VRDEEHTITVEGAPVFYRVATVAGEGASAEGKAAPATPVFLHTAPTSSGDWRSVLERTGGIAPDLIGFGRSAKGGHLDYSPLGMARFVEAVLAQAGVQRIQLVAHGWGATVAGALAGLDPGRTERMLLIDPAPPLGAPAWHGWARLWSRPVVGELAMGAMTRSMLARSLRGASVRREAWPEERIRELWEQFDQGTQRAVLRIHRWAREATLTKFENELPELHVPCLVLYGEQDTWSGGPAARTWARALGAEEPVAVLSAGHWPWLDRPELVDRIAEHLGR